MTELKGPIPDPFMSTNCEKGTSQVFVVTRVIPDFPVFYSDRFISNCRVTFMGHCLTKSGLRAHEIPTVL